jgi:hypothetical protein
METNRDKMRREIREWAEGREYTTKECYPFEAIEVLGIEFMRIVERNGAQYEGIMTKGESLVFHSHWESEGVKFRTLINPRNDGECRAQFLFIPLEGIIY